MKNKKIVIVLIALCCLSMLIVACIASPDGNGGSSDNGKPNEIKPPSVNQDGENKVWINIYYAGNIIARVNCKQNSEMDISQYIANKSLSKVCDATGIILQVANGKLSVGEKDVFVFLVDTIASYEIAISADENCEINVQKSAMVGEKIVFTVRAKENYFVENVIAVKAGGKEIELSSEVDNTYSFVMIASKVEVQATSKKNSFSITSQNNSDNTSSNAMLEIEESSVFGNIVEGKFIVGKGYRVKNLQFCDGNGLPLTPDQIVDLNIKTENKIVGTANSVGKFACKSGSMDIINNILNECKLTFEMPKYNIQIMYDEEKIKYKLTIKNTDGVAEETIEINKYFGDNFNFVIATMLDGYAFDKVIAYQLGDEIKTAIDISLKDSSGGNNFDSGKSVFSTMLAMDIVIEVVAKKIDFTVEKIVEGFDNKQDGIDDILSTEKDTYNFGDKVDFVLNLPSGYILKSNNVFTADGSAEIPLIKIENSAQYNSPLTHKNSKNNLYGNSSGDRYSFVMPCQNVKIKVVLWNSLQSVWSNLLQNIDVVLLNSFKDICNFDKFSGVVPQFSTSEKGYESDVLLTQIPRQYLGKKSTEFYRELVETYNFVNYFFKSEQVILMKKAFESIRDKLAGGEVNITIDGKYRYTFLVAQNEIFVKIAWSNADGNIEEIEIKNTLENELKCEYEIKGNTFSIEKRTKSGVDGSIIKVQNTQNIEFAKDFVLTAKASDYDIEGNPKDKFIQFSDTAKKLFLKNDNNLKNVILHLERQAFESIEVFDEQLGNNKTIIKQSNDKLIDPLSWRVVQEFDIDMLTRYTYEESVLLDFDGTTQYYGLLIPMAIVGSFNAQRTYKMNLNIHSINGQDVINLIDIYGGSLLCAPIMYEQSILKLVGTIYEVSKICVPSLLINEKANEANLDGWEKEKYDEFVILNSHLFL